MAAKLYALHIIYKFYHIYYINYTLYDQIIKVQKMQKCEEKDVKRWRKTLSFKFLKTFFHFLCLFPSFRIFFHLSGLFWCGYFRYCIKLLMTNRHSHERTDGQTSAICYLHLIILLSSSKQFLVVFARLCNNNTKLIAVFEELHYFR